LYVLISDKEQHTDF